MQSVKKFFLLLLPALLFPAGEMAGQFYETGQPPASVKWEQINTENFRIIYPVTFQREAFRLAGLLKESHDLTGHTLGHRPRKIPVLVHSHNARSNGLVSWAPRRMELYPLPPQDSRGHEWLLQLAVHEQRHVVQVDRMNRGATRFLSFFLGEQAHGIAVGRLPLWFLEGDAVSAETALTLSGRGRTPSFDMPLRALLMSRSDNFSYDKFLFRSYRDYVPDHYTYGYQMVAGLRKEYGPQIWENTLENIARRPLNPAPFAGALRRQTGSGPARLHESAMDYLRGQWDSLTSERGFVEYDRINSRSGELYLNFRYPAWLGDSAVVALKSGIAQREEFVVIDTAGIEKSLFFPGPLSSPSFSLSGNRIAWSEYKPDLRWGLRDHSVIIVLDMFTGRERRLNHSGRYFAPSFAPEGLFLAVVEVDPGNSHFLILMNSVTGEVAGRYEVPGQLAIQRPAFGPSGREIFMTFTSGDGTGIMMFDLDTGGWETVLEPSFINISGVFMNGGLVCFHSDHTGNDDLFALDRDSGEIYRLTSSRFGAFDGSISSSGEKMAWAGYTSAGFDLATAGFVLNEPAPLTLSAGYPDNLPGILASHEKGIMPLSDAGSDGWQAESYRKGLNLFNFHSWAPFYYDYRELNIDRQTIYPGFVVLSQNLLNTASTFAGYSYREGRHIVHGNFIYKGWYPVIEAGFDYGDTPGVFMGRDTTGLQNAESGGRLNINNTVRVPLNLTSGRYVAGVEPWFRINYNNDYYHHDREDVYKRGMVTTDTRFLAYRYRRRSQRDLAPGWGQVLRWRMRSAPFESENLGIINAVELTLYVPGPAPHHSLRLDAALQRQDPVKYYYSSLVRFPRGYESERTGRLRLLKTGYSFPLLYPDLSIPGVLYLRRLHGEIFADAGVNRLRVFNQSENRMEWQEEKLLSAGGSLTAEFYLFRIVFPFNMSTGVAYIPSRDEYSFLFSFGMDVNIF